MSFQYGDKKREISYLYIKRSGQPLKADTKDGDDTELPVTGCFIAIGHIPNTQFLDGQLETDANGYLITNSNSTTTAIEGVWACGDVQDHVLGGQGL